jgi:GTP:adenosylcobinamide-phosphate guanylyltransferase
VQSTKPLAKLGSVVRLGGDKLQNPDAASLYGGIQTAAPVLVILAAGKGTRFGQAPKCIQPVRSTPLARHSIDAFRRYSPSPVVCLVGYRHEEVSRALGKDNLYVRSDQPAGGTAYAALEAFSVPSLLKVNPLLIITMGDRIVTPGIFRRLCETHTAGTREADLSLLTAIYEPPKNQGKGRVLRDANQGVLRITEQRDIDALEDAVARRKLQALTEGNCPLYAVRAATLSRHLQELTNANAQGQYYLTDIVETISREGGDIRTITTTVADPEYDLLCSDVTRPMDLALLESVVASAGELLSPGESDVGEAARLIAADRPKVQVTAIARQLEELLSAVSREKLGFAPNQPVAIGISGGRFRIAFMHPDMTRFFGPAWQMPIGAGNTEGEEQIVLLAQPAETGQIQLFPTNPKYRESVNYIASDIAVMYPGEEISDWHTYEEFGTRMSESLLLSLGYFTDEELQRRRERQQPLPPPSLWVGNNMRRPFSLVGNAIASMRTLRKGHLGTKVQAHLGRDSFRGLRLVSTGAIPQGGFSSSSAVTVAVKNAINALFDLDIPSDLLIHLACQAEYGTGVRAGSLDQATEQKGRAGQGTLISSNPRDNYAILGTYPVPAERFHVFFPYTVPRDREAWRWSWGTYAETPGPGRLTPGEMRKLTGKAAEIAALLIRLPLDVDFFKPLENDLLEDGLLNQTNRAFITETLRQIPFLASPDELRQKLEESRGWYLSQWIEVGGLDPQSATQKVDATIASLLSGWRNPVLRRTTASGQIVEECGVPLRAMMAYLYAEVAKNFYLIHHPEEWIEWVTRSQWGDRCFDIDARKLPSRKDMESLLAWEKGWSGPALMERWLARFQARPFDYQRGLDDKSLSNSEPPEFHKLEGGNFFRGLALIDLAEAMLKRAFGEDAVAMRVNAAGQGDYFQVHVDTQKVAIEEVKQFLRLAFYRRFGLSPEPDFVEIHPGGGAVGVRLNRYDSLSHLVQKLKSLNR